MRKLNKGNSVPAVKKKEKTVKTLPVVKKKEKKIKSELFAPYSKEKKQINTRKKGNTLSEALLDLQEFAPNIEKYLKKKQTNRHA